MKSLDEEVLGINHQWSRFLVEELVRQGVSHFIVSTGSRSTPLAVAIAERDDINKFVHFDERGAAYFALGYGRSTGSPAALVCTSGTAAVNYYPAIVEASMANIPMIVLTADRPVSVRDAGTDQVINQVNLFGSYLRWQFDFPAPETTFQADYILTAVDQATNRASMTPRGPVHLNCGFAKPLLEGALLKKKYYQSTLSLDKWREQKEPFTSYAGVSYLSDSSSLENVAAKVRKARRGVLVCGALPIWEDKQSIFQLATTLGWPIIADITSGLRFGQKEGAFIVAHSDLYFQSPTMREQFSPDVILHLGGEPVNNSLQFYLRDSGAQHILVNDHPFRQDPGRTVTDRVIANPADFANRLSEYLEINPSELFDLFARAESKMERLLIEELSLEKQGSQWQISPMILKSIGDGHGLFLGNSLPVREMDRYISNTDKKVMLSCNRGVSGIDGNLSTACGQALGLGAPLTLYTGDVAMLHDLNSLALARDSSQPLTIVIPNNDGGGVFPFLPNVGETKNFKEFFVAPHGRDFMNAAKMFDVDYHKVRNPGEFSEIYSKVVSGDQSSLIEVVTDRELNLQEQRDLYAKAQELH